MVSGVGRLDSPNNNGIAPFGGHHIIEQQLLPPFKVPLIFVGVAQNANVRRLWQLQSQSKDGRYNKGCDGSDQKHPPNLVQSGVVRRENTSDETLWFDVDVFVVVVVCDALIAMSFGDLVLGSMTIFFVADIRIASVFVLLEAIPADAAREATTTAAFYTPPVIQAERGEDQDATHNVVERDEKAVEDGKQLQGSNGANSRGKEGHCRCDLRARNKETHQAGNSTIQGTWSVRSSQELSRYTEREKQRWTLCHVSTHRCEEHGGCSVR